MSIASVELPDKSIDRILGWVELGVKATFNRRQLHRDKATLLANYAALPANKHWIHLELHAVSIGLNPAKGSHLYQTIKLLRTLPPPGPARASRELHPGQPLKEHVWGLETDPKVGS